MKKISLILALTAVAAGRAAAQAPDFAKDIAPILEASCVKCHNDKKAKGKLNMATKAGFEKGGEDGKLVEPGKPDDSALIKVLLLPEDHDDAMPPKDKAPRPTAAQIDTLKKWIADGAKWPDGATLKVPEGK
jgi:mono/diheme cytochrome c family protein